MSIVYSGFHSIFKCAKSECFTISYTYLWPAIPHAFRVRLQQLPSLMRDTRLRLLPYFQSILALIIAPTPYILSLSKIALIWISIALLPISLNCPPPRMAGLTYLLSLVVSYWTEVLIMVDLSNKSHMLRSWNQSCSPITNFHPVPWPHWKPLLTPVDIDSKIKCDIEPKSYSEVNWNETHKGILRGPQTQTKM